MAGHREINTSFTGGTQVTGLRLKDPLVDALFGPNTGPDVAAQNTKALLRNILILVYASASGSTLAEAETYVDANTDNTE